MQINKDVHTKTPPLVSIIVPVYNAEKYLERCLNSLVSQTLHKIEILCVNDGSTDKSLEILTAYAEKHPFLFIFNQENHGPGAARNTALDNARGKYIIFCDADDILTPDACLECTTLIEKTGVDLIVFNINMIDSERVDSNGKKLFGSGELRPVVQKNTEGLHNLKELLKITNNASLIGRIFRTELVNRHNLRLSRYRISEDSIFFLSYVMLIQSAYTVNKTFYTWYAHKGSLSDIGFGKNPWLNRVFLLPRLLFSTFCFAIKIKKPLKHLFIYHWMYYYIRSRL